MKPKLKETKADLIKLIQKVKTWKELKEIFTIIGSAGFGVDLLMAFTGKRIDPKERAELIAITLKRQLKKWGNKK